jgi:2-aminoadipate transaminase
MHLETPPMSKPCHVSQRAQRAGGQPISFMMQKSLAHPELISFAAGLVDQDTLPVDLTRQVFDKILSDPGRGRAALQYGTTAGYLPLRQSLLERLCQADGCSETELSLAVEQVVVTAGSNELLHLLVDTLCDPGDIVLCASPSYYVFVGTLHNMGVRSVGVLSDEHGLIPEAVDDELRRIEGAGELGRVKAIYVVSYFDNPANTTIPADRRAALVEIAQRWSKRSRIHILEDAAYRDLLYEGSDVPSFRAFDPTGETVIVTQTFSKAYSPGVRVGWGVLPPHLVEPLLDQKSNVDFGSPNLTQHLMSEVLSQGLLEPHLETVRNGYRAKRDAMVAAADQYLARIPGVHWTRPTGGLYVWLQLPPEIEAGNSGRLFEQSMQEGVLYVPGEYFYPNEGRPVAKNTIRLSFGVQSCDRIREGIAALARAIERCLK